MALRPDGQPEAQTRLALNTATAAELMARYRTRAEAEAALTSYLLGVMLTLGMTPQDFLGFDDASGELILREGAAIPRRRR